MLRPALTLLLFFTLFTGVLYPLAMTAVGQGLLPLDASAQRPGAVGQAFTGDEWFQGRPSALALPSDARNSGGSNLGPTNPAFLDAVRARVALVRQHNPSQHGLVPADLVTASGSGLDPHLSPAGAHYQVARVAQARGLNPARLDALVDTQTEGRWLGLFGEPRVNVVRLNRLLSALATP
jgi:K+-transporting ATPase ATPase C chain